VSDKSTAVCPPLIGDPSPPGCNLTFVQDVDGEFPCETSDDCPMGYGWWDEQPEGICANPTTDGRRTYAACNEKKCNFQASDCGYFVWCFDEDENMIIKSSWGEDYECYADEDCQIRSGVYYTNTLYNYQTLNSQLDMKCENKKQQVYLTK